MRSHVMRDLYFYSNYTLLLVYYIYYFNYKIKIAPGEFDIRCLFIVLLRQVIHKVDPLYLLCRCLIIINLGSGMTLSRGIHILQTIYTRNYL